MQKQFKFVPFSLKQKKILTWWVPGNPFATKDAIIADGAVRSGKTLIMSFSFVLWAMETFSGANFGMAGKTIGSFKRNVWMFLKRMLFLRGFKVRKLTAVGENVFAISKNNKENYFHFFGGKDERSQDLVQGFTAAGFYFDEVALMPQSFVNQAVARCSEEGSKLWFNCNPEGPFHWFKVDWLEQLKRQNAFRLQFYLDDNPSLSEEKKEQYKRRYSGIFYERYILGLWVLAEGVIYSMFNKNMVINKIPANIVINKKWIGIDYGQSNATAFLLCGLGSDNKLYILNEYFHAGKTEKIQKSPSKYSQDFLAWKIKNGVEGMPVNVERVFIDPSAKGFMLQLHENGERNIWQADNEVLKGIELISSLIDSDNFRVLSCCTNVINELGTYRWDVKAQNRGQDKPVKQNDHTLDALRYVINGTRQIWQRILQQRNEKTIQKLPVA